MVLFKLEILFSVSLLTSSILSETALISEFNFALNSSLTAALADSHLAMRFSANFSFSYLSSDFKFYVAEVNLESILASNAICLADSVVNFASKAAICLADSADCLLLSLVSLACKAAVCLQFSDWMICIKVKVIPATA
jgi:hypothetical protein